MRRTSTQAVVRSSSATARAINGGRSGWTVGHGRTSSRGWSSGGTAGPATVLRGARPDTGTAVRSGGHPRATASHRGSSRSAAPVRAAPTPACPRSRDVTRRDLAARHPETARACRPRDHVPVPARDRQHRDHCRSSRAACSDDPADPRLPRRHGAPSGRRANTGSRMDAAAIPARPPASPRWPRPRTSSRSERSRHCDKSPNRSCRAGALDIESTRRVVGSKRDANRPYPSLASRYVDGRLAKGSDLRTEQRAVRRGLLAPGRGLPSARCA
jgi:hypothetical protein